MNELHLGQTSASTRPKRASREVVAIIMLKHRCSINSSLSRSQNIFYLCRAHALQFFMPRLPDREIKFIPY